VLLAILNVVVLSLDLVQRAGMIWFVNQTVAPVGGPNEAASTLLLLIALLLVRQTLALRLSNLVMIGIALGLLVATLSRSGLLAVLTFSAMVVPRARLRWVVLAAFAVLAALPFIPEDYWTRIGRTLVLERGTFETYTSLIRVYGWKIAIQIFLDNPWLGVGYVGYSAVAGGYGELRLTGIPVDNFYLETAAGMGLPGLVALGAVIVRMFQLGAIVRRHAPAGSLGHVMARYHTPLWIGMLIVNLTGNNFVGIVVLGQLAVWSAMLVRAGDMAMESRFD
jgi:O-antigen ligase